MLSLIVYVCLLSVGFKIEKFGQEISKEEEKIDIQDLVVSLSILAHMDTEEKLECFCSSSI